MGGTIPKGLAPGLVVEIEADAWLGSPRPEKEA